MCKLGGLWKKKGEHWFKCDVCGKELHGWRTWFMVPYITISPIKFKKRDCVEDAV